MGEGGGELVEVRVDETAHYGEVFGGGGEGGGEADGGRDVGEGALLGGGCSVVRELAG